MRGEERQAENEEEEKSKQMYPEVEFTKIKSQGLDPGLSQDFLVQAPDDGFLYRLRQHLFEQFSVA